MQLTIHLVLLGGAVVVLGIQSHQPFGPAANIATVVCAGVLTLGTVCRWTTCECAARYGDGLVVIGDLIVAMAVGLAIWTVAEFEDSAPPFYATFPLVLFVMASLLHVYAIYDDRAARRTEWLESIRMPLTPDDDGGDGDPRSPMVGTRSRGVSFEVTDNPFEAPSGHRFTIGTVD